MKMYIAEKNKKLYIVHEDYGYQKPVVQKLWYPTEVYAPDYPEFIGCEVRGNGFGNGIYSIIRNDGFGMQQNIRMINDGKTVPEFCEEIEVPKPNVKKELRWSDIYGWQKLLKSGWVSA
jgi:hypothetical protein